jgi:hypothetical protein
MNGVVSVGAGPAGRADMVPHDTDVLCVPCKRRQSGLRRGRMWRRLRSLSALRQ